MYSSLRMLPVALICSALAACGPDDSGSAAAATGTPTQGAQAASAPTAVSLAPPPATTTATSSSMTSPTASSGSGETLVASTTSLVTATTGQPIPAAPSTLGFTTLRVKNYTGTQLPTDSDVGSFRLTCGYSHMAFDDPIVFPGKPGASHLHTFFGNTSTDGLTTTESLLGAKSSTCAGGIANLSSYWEPSMIDVKTGRAVVPSRYIVYYKKSYNGLTNEEIKAPPNGLRMVTGRSATATGPSTERYPPYIARFKCDSGAYTGTIPACPAGSELHAELSFQNCWDGQNLDSPDHRSHMAYAKAQTDDRCPASHPVPIPTITMNVIYVVEPGADASHYRLSSDKYPLDQPGGYSFHGDVWIAWDEDIKATWVKNCINAGKDCHAYLLGDGRMLY